MSNTEETSESSLKRGSFVDDFLESGRKKIKTSLSTNDKHIEDIEYMLKVLYKEAKIEKKGRRLTITTQKVTNTKDFGNLPSMSEDLSKLVYVDPPGESDILLDYNKYLEKSSILCEDVLLPFLAGFKEHLENVQVFLAQIEAWLLEPEVIDSFLDQTFDVTGCRMRDDKDPSKIYLYRSFCLDVDSKMESTFDICTEDGREVLKAAFAFVKTFKPFHQIEVKDAGEKAVDGTYTREKIGNNCSYFYTRSGLCDGKPAIFFLARHKRLSDDSIMWCMYCKYEYPSIGTVIFYETEAKGEEYELPTLNGWRIGGDEDDKGVDPPPKILYKVDVV